MNFILTKSVYSKNWTKTLKSVIMNDTGPHLGKSQNLKSSSELTYRMYKLCKFLLVCTYQNYYDENIWSCQRRKYKINKEKNAKNTIILSIIRHRYFDTNHFISWFVYFLVYFGDNQLILRGRGLAVFVNKINNLATQSWKKNSGFCFIEN